MHAEHMGTPTGVRRPPGPRGSELKSDHHATYINPLLEAQRQRATASPGDDVREAAPYASPPLFPRVSNATHTPLKSGTSKLPSLKKAYHTLRKVLGKHVEKAAEKWHNATPLRLQHQRELRPRSGPAKLTGREPEPRSQPPPAMGQENRHPSKRAPSATEVSKIVSTSQMELLSAQALLASARMMTNPLYGGTQSGDVAGISGLPERGPVRQLDFGQGDLGFTDNATDELERAASVGTDEGWVGEESAMLPLPSSGEESAVDQLMAHRTRMAQIVGAGGICTWNERDAKRSTNVVELLEEDPEDAQGTHMFHAFATEIAERLQHAEVRSGASDWTPADGSAAVRACSDIIWEGYINAGHIDAVGHAAGELVEHVYTEGGRSCQAGHFRPASTAQSTVHVRVGSVSQLPLEKAAARAAPSGLQARLRSLSLRDTPTKAAVGLDSPAPTRDMVLYSVGVSLIHGTTPLTAARTTEEVAADLQEGGEAAVACFEPDRAQWQWLDMGVLICDLPRAARLAVTLYESAQVHAVDASGCPLEGTGMNGLNERRSVGEATLVLVDAHGWLLRGPQVMHLQHCEPGGQRVDTGVVVHVDLLPRSPASLQDPHPFRFPALLGVHSSQHTDGEQPSRRQDSPSRVPPSDHTAETSGGVWSGDSVLEELIQSSLGSGCKPNRFAPRQRSTWGSSALHVASAGPRETYEDLLWNHRDVAASGFPYLPPFLQATLTASGDRARQAHEYVRRWAQPSQPCEAMVLLDSLVACPVARAFAISVLSQLSDSELEEYLAQLLQALKHEPYIDSALARFLLARALASPNSIGHALFWHLQAEPLHVRSYLGPGSQPERMFNLLQAEYITHCPSLQQNELLSQCALVQQLTYVGVQIKLLPNNRRSRALLESLSHLQLPDVFCLPSRPQVSYCGIDYDNCKPLISKKAPLWLTLHTLPAPVPPATEPGHENGRQRVLPSFQQHERAPSEDATPPTSRGDCNKVNNRRRTDLLSTQLIFKVGDDLRQDCIVLQMLRRMDTTWKASGIDLQMTSYHCMSVSHMVGLIEVVPGAETVASITQAAGGAMAAFRDDAITSWLRKHNPQKTAYNAAVRRFMLSCAGYCVATFLLGVGDRHNDNIMLCPNGSLLHIDYGHFLGNYKRFFGVIKRETAPFVFTPDFAQVLGGTRSFTFLRFVTICCKAYNLLRASHQRFHTLFSLMVPSGLAELHKLDHLQYLQDAFAPSLSDDEAAERFTALIYEALETKRTQVNNAIHILARQS